MFSDEETAVLLHATGLNNSTKAYRDHYCAPVNTPAFEACAELVKQGLMVEGRSQESSKFFHMTDNGLKAARSIMGKRMYGGHRGGGAR